MATIRLEVVTPERVVLEDDADIVIARGAEGDLGVLHGHEPLITPLDAGSPAAILKAMYDAPHLTEEDVAQLERAIEEGKLPVSQEGVFDGAR